MKQIGLPHIFLAIIFLLAGCSPNESTSTSEKPVQPPETQPGSEEQGIPPPSSKEPTMDKASFANVLSVSVTGEPGKYQFAVEVASPDTGCGQYADWWEVVSQDGELLYRRILLHSHVDEQPFTRSGGPVAIDANAVVFIRAHMNTTGYGGQVLQGTVQGGFELVEVKAGFGSKLERVPPQPEDCAF